MYLILSRLDVDGLLHFPGQRCALWFELIFKILIDKQK